MADEKNVLVTDDVIAKESLRLLKNNLVMAPIVFRDYEKRFATKVGDTIRVKLPYRVKSTSGRVLDKKPLVDETTDITINHQEHVGLETTVLDRTLSISDFSERYLESGICQIANVIDRSLLLTLKNAFHSSGTPGTRGGAFIDFANAAAKQTTYAVPNDGLRCAVVDPFTLASVSNEVTKLLNNTMTKRAYTMGYQGDVSKYKLYESQNIPSHQVGTHGGTPLAAAANVNGDTILTDGWDTSVTDLLNVGDVFTVAGVYGVNPQSYETTGILLDFVVQEQVDSSAGGLASITVSPALNDGTATTLNSEGDTISLEAYQNVTALPADGAAITVMGVAESIYEQNYLFHKEAIALAMVQRHLPQSAVSKARARDKQTGLSMTVITAYDINQDSEITRIDALWGEKLIYPELALRKWGAAIG